MTAFPGFEELRPDGPGDQSEEKAGNTVNEAVNDAADKRSAVLEAQEQAIRARQTARSHHVTQLQEHDDDHRKDDQLDDTLDG